MKYKIVAFEEIVAGVMDETGITDLRNREPQIRRMIAAAEKDINPYSGFFAKKKVKYYKGNKWFDGKNFKKPDDFVSLDEAGTCSDGICPGSYYETATHIIFCDGKIRDSVTLTYYYLNCDGRGNPVTTENHKPAVINYITWKLYSQRVFLGQGAANVKKDYQNVYEDSALAARGHDAFPSDEELEFAHNLFMASSAEIATMKFPKRSVMISCECMATQETENPNNPIDVDPTNEIKVYWGQLPGANKIEITNELIQSIIDNDQDDETVAYREIITLAQAIEGYSYNFDIMGRYFFIIEDVNDNSIEIYDLLMQSMGDSLEKHYDPDKRRLIFYSQFYITPSNIYFKFVYNEG